jgi:hypothetical protein
MSRDGKLFLLLVGFAIFFLFAVSFGAIRSKKAAGSFELHNIVLCDELDDRMNPIGGASSFSYGIRQLCLRFDYSRAGDGENIQVRWYYRGRPIHSQEVALSPGSGARVFCLLLEDGSPLPRGSYSVRISLFDRDVSDTFFEISE